MRQVVWALVLVGCMQSSTWGQPPLPAAPANRRVSFNRRPATARDLDTLNQLELRWGQRLPDGSYWYDNVSGAAGTWGGPATALLPAGLELGGPLPANASGGGTGVFINGREIHPADARVLWQYTGYPPRRGRYWVDAQGNFGYERGAMIGNLHALARAKGGAGGQKSWTSRVDALTGRSSDNLNMASDGTTTCVSQGGYSHCTGD